MKLKITALIMALILLISAAGCSAGKAKDNEDSSSDSASETPEEKDPEYPVNVFGTDIDARPGIVVSLSPALTAKVIELGLEKRLEGISDDCEEPEGSNLTRCGDAKIPNLEEIQNISPHLVISETPLSEKSLISLQEMGADAVIIPRAGDISQLKENYVAIAKLFDGERTGRALGEKFFESKFQKKLDEIKEKALAEPKNAVFIGELDFNVATGDMLESALMEEIGLNNIAKDQTGGTYPEEEAKSAGGLENFNSIDFIFCDKSTVTMKMMEQSAFYKRLNAVLKDYYLYIDSKAFGLQSLKMLDELERMAMYINGEIESSKSEESPAPPAQTPVSQAPAPTPAPAPAPTPEPSSSEEEEPPPEDGGDWGEDPADNSIDDGTGDEWDDENYDPDYDETDGLDE